MKYESKTKKINLYNPIEPHVGPSGHSPSLWIIEAIRTLKVRGSRLEPQTWHGLSDSDMPSFLVNILKVVSGVHLCPVLHPEPGQAQSILSLLHPCGFVLFLSIVWFYVLLFFVLFFTRLRG